MKDIIIFGKEFPATHPLMVIGEYSTQVLYLSDKSRKANPNKILGYQPDLIINLNKPDEELDQWQKRQEFGEGAMITDLY